LLLGEDGNEGNDENRMSGLKGCLDALGGLFWADCYYLTVN